MFSYVLVDILVIVKVNLLVLIKKYGALGHTYWCNDILKIVFLIIFYFLFYFFFKTFCILTPYSQIIFSFSSFSSSSEISFTISLFLFSWFLFPLNPLVRIELLKTWHDVINLEFIIYLMMFSFHFYLSLFHVLYFMSILTYIFCIVCDLGALGVA